MQMASNNRTVQSTENQAQARWTAADDKRLVAEVLRKDRKATAQFVEQYANCVYAYVRRRLMPHREAVEDLVQETFLAAWENLASFRGQVELRFWLLGIAQHKVEDYYRKRFREVELPEDENDSAVATSVIPMHDEYLDGVLEQRRVQRILAALPEAYCLALLWRYKEDLSVREMAQLSGKTEKAMERLLARARQQFRRRWQE